MKFAVANVLLNMKHLEWTNVAQFWNALCITHCAMIK